MKFSEYGSRESLKRNLYAVIFIITLYLSVPFTKSLSNFLISLNLFRLSAYIIISLFIIISLIIIFRYISFSFSNMLWLSAFFVLYFIIIQNYNVPSKKMHFIEYGILAFLLYHSLKLKIDNYSIYPLSFLIVVSIGLGDELIQFFTPGRHCSFQDMILNGLSCALILILIFISEKLKGKAADNRSDHGDKAYKCKDNENHAEE